MRKIIFTIILLFVALNSNAAISQSGITNLKQLDKNGIIDLVNGNQLKGFISDGPFEGPITQTYFKDGTYETVYENKTYKGKWRAEGESYSSVNDKKMCTKNNDASKWSCFHWYTGIKDGGTYAYIIAYGQIFHQYHEVKSIAQVNQEKRKAEEAKRIADAKKAEEAKKIAELILNKKLALIPPQSKLLKAQDFIKDLEEFVENNPNEFDIMDIAMFKINTKPLSEGLLNDEQMSYIEDFKSIVQTSSAFTKFQKTQEEKRLKVNLSNIDQLLSKLDSTLKKIQSVSKIDISSDSASLRDKTIQSSKIVIDNAVTLSELENLSKELNLLLINLNKEEKRNITIKQEIEKIKVDIDNALLILDEDINKQKRYLAENLSSISPELMTLVVENVSKLEKIKKHVFNSDKEKLTALQKVNSETVSFFYDNNILTSAELELKKKKESAIKKEEERKKKAEAKKIEIENAKYKKPDKQQRFINIINSAKSSYIKAESDLAKGKILYDRTQKICKLNTYRVSNWKGKVHKISINQDGWGVFAVQIDGDLYFSTYSTAYEDYGSDTLISPGSSAFRTIMNLERGDKISFSGSFFKEEREKGTCLSMFNVLLIDRVKLPNYLFRFTDVKKIN